jgi:AcrR family transcriptional regulator
MKSLDTGERILKESGNMFFQHGIRTITMDDIATSLGISKKTIYLYYHDKSQLVKSFTESELKHQEKDMQTIQKTSTDPVEEILNMMTYLENFFNRVNPAVFYDLQKYHPQSWNSFKIFKEKCIIGFVEDNLRRGIQQELYRRDLKTKVLARLRIEEVEMGFNTVVFPQDKFNLTEVQITLIDHFLHGIVTMKGFKLIEKHKKIHKK